MRKSARFAEQGLHGYHLPFSKGGGKVLLSVPSQHKPQPSLIRATATQFVHSHDDPPPSSMCCVTGYRLGQSMAPNLNLHEWMWRNESTQAAADSLSFQRVCASRPCGALPHPSLSFNAGRARAQRPPVQTPGPGHPRHPVLRHIF